MYGLTILTSQVLFFTLDISKHWEQNFGVWVLKTPGSLEIGACACSTLVIFQKHRRTIIPLPSLTLQGVKINIMNSYKFLGLTFDQKLSWIPHIKTLKAKCLNATKIHLLLPTPGVTANYTSSINYIKALFALCWTTVRQYIVSLTNLPKAFSTLFKYQLSE